MMAGWMVIFFLACVSGGTNSLKNSSRGCAARDDEECSWNTNVWTRSTRQYTQNDAADDLLLERLRQYAPQFDPSIAEGASAQCRRHVNIYFKELASLKLWALKLYDSTAKIPSGLLNGNVNQLGAFDQCLSVSHQTGSDHIRGRYCLAAVQLELHGNASEAVKNIHRHLHSNYAFRSDLDDPGHRVPKFSSINWGVCVPSGCDHSDVEQTVSYYLSGLVEGTNIEIGVRVKEDTCQTGEQEPLAWGTFVSIGLFSIIFVAVAIATAIHHTRKNKNKYVLAFSLKHNVEKMMRTSADDIGCVHGIRFLNSLMLIVSHKSMAVMFLPFFNRTDMSLDIGKPWTVVSRAASLYTDPFIMFSGLLTTYSILRRLSKQGHITLHKEYISRLVRIVPSFAALIVFCTWVMPHLSSGPLWGQVVTSHAHICKRYWWRNMLFIHNYFGFENMCLTHTHHIGIDTQLFFTTPPVVVLLWYWPRATIRALVALAGLSTAARYLVTYSMGLSNYVFYGTSVKQLFETADFMYILPAHRATVYIMGVLLGYWLHTSKDTALSKKQLQVGWAVATAMLLISFVGPAGMGKIDYVYDNNQAACYAAFAPIFWCAFFAWVIYTSHLGYTSHISKVLSWRGYALWTKISYSVYLTQFPVFFYTVGVVRTPQEYSFISQLMNIKEYSWILITSIMLTLFIEFPCQNIKDVLMSRPSNLAPPKNTEKPAEEKILNQAVLIVENSRHIDTDKTK